MVNGRPLFPGTGNEDQLVKIFKVLGTPQVSEHPQLAELPQWNKDFPQYAPLPWEQVVSRRSLRVARQVVLVSLQATSAALRDSL